MIAITFNKPSVWQVGDTIDLTVDPPPDLIVEVDISHPSLDKFPIYASLGVPEVRRHNGDTLQFFRLVGRSLHTDTGKQSVSSAVSGELAGFVQQGMAHGIIPMIRAFRLWGRSQRQP